MRTLAATGAGFLLAVLWFDLMFDVQIRHTEDEREKAVASISTYYRRVTTDARPMNRLVALAMLVTLGSTLVELVRGASPTWAWSACLALVGGPMTLALAHTVPNAVRLGRGNDDGERKYALARSIFRDHLVCLGCIAASIAVLLGAF